MTLLRMLAFRPADATGSTREASGGRAAPPVLRRPQKAVSAPTASPASVAASSDGDWPALLAQLELKGPARQLAGNCQLVAREGSHFRFLLDERASALHTRQLEDASRRRCASSSASRRQSKSSGAVRATRPRAARSGPRRTAREARAALERDPNVQTLRDRFGAVLQPDSVKPVG